MLHKETHRYQFGNGELMKLLFVYFPGLLDMGRANGLFLCSVKFLYIRCVQLLQSLF